MFSRMAGAAPLVPPAWQGQCLCHCSLRLYLHFLACTVFALLWVLQECLVRTPRGQHPTSAGVLEAQQAREAVAVAVAALALAPAPGLERGALALGLGVRSMQARQE